MDVERAATVIMAAVVGLTFGFGKLLSLALRLGVPVWVAPLIAPADLGFAARDEVPLDLTLWL